MSTKMNEPMFFNKLSIVPGITITYGKFYGRNFHPASQVQFERIKEYVTINPIEIQPRKQSVISNQYNYDILVSQSTQIKGELINAYQINPSTLLVISDQISAEYTDGAEHHEHVTHANQDEFKQSVIEIFKVIRWTENLYDQRIIKKLNRLVNTSLQSNNGNEDRWIDR